MVHFQLDKVPGQRGHMIVQEDGTIISVRRNCNFFLYFTFTKKVLHGNF